MIFFVAALMGIVIGSFISVVTLRVPKKESFVSGHSRCPLCNHNLYVKDLFPIFSWLFLKGSCRYCKKHISIRYPLIEFICGIIAILSTIFTQTILWSIIVSLISFFVLSLLIMLIEKNRKT